MIKSRITFAAKETNAGKLQQLDDLYAAYQTYLQSCIDLMIKDHLIDVLPSLRRSYFPENPNLTSHIKKACQGQATKIVHTWVRGLYGRKLSKKINKLETLTDQQKMELRCCGKYGVTKAGKFGKGLISQEMVDLFYSWVWDAGVVGKPPIVSDRIPMVMTEMTCVFGKSKHTKDFQWWLRFSGLQSGKRIQIPLADTPYLKEGLAKTVIVSKKNDRWRFQFSEELPDAVLDGSKGTIGVDVGLNVLAATSDGRLFGANFKPKFDKLFNKVKLIRANRQRQGLKENSKRLDKLEQKLTGLTKTATGTVANKLVKAYPEHTFVVEDLDLRGCKGQKRFAYRQLQSNLGNKAVLAKVNPAYTSQECPSCHHADDSNRNGIKFVCKGCGRKNHADVVGSVNILGRSKDKCIRLNDYPFVVKRVLDERHLAMRRASSPIHGSKRLKKRPRTIAPVPSGHGLTVKGDCLRGMVCIDSNQPRPNTTG